LEELAAAEAVVPDVRVDAFDCGLGFVIPGD
jgi:hypothetical protein